MAAPEVRLGLWEDHSASTISRYVLTLTITQSNYLIAALSLLLVVLLPIIWSSVVFFFYLVPYIRGTENTTPELNQRRFILRNSSRPSDLLFGLGSAFWAWRSIQGEREDFQIGEDSPLLDVDLGPRDKQNFTFSYQLSPLKRMGYEVNTASAYRGFSDAANISWVPIPSLNRTDADVSAILIAANLLTYAQSVDDPVFQANGSIKDPIRSLELGTEQVMYLSDYTLRVVACADQHEFCDPISGACSGLDGHLGGGVRELLRTVNNNQAATIVRIQHDSQLYTMEGSVRSLGANGKFPSRKLVLLSIVLLYATHWQKEVQMWFETGLARLQANVAKFPDQPLEGNDSDALQLVPASRLTGDTSVDRALEDMCGEQRVHSTSQVQNFSLIGLVILVGSITLLAAICGLLVPRVASWMFSNGYSEWKKDEVLAVWKMAYDPQGRMKWIEKDVPVAIGRQDAHA
ncbi:uncharacterized protein J7T54_004870 [Emericellopsis cladophorae]|uniref:Uncharacterized protein n=1 Tax=Emericellopsis cladophorae TaxID=2686198 RepID=A0A9Q0BB16_9HYPO|nr:uncharacterized protein J7T54_004870 [Emericellopsis cladophorae]KAI6777574.1 hypothetical protein J7T54_004870 [Emericellopsis cladophorae]